jgi:predicted GIY-YIG superfamily endonuclease
MQTVYLLHFDRPLKHARHYLGWTTNLDARLEHHLKGSGARLVRAVVQSGIGVTLARQWRGEDRNFERKLKNRNNGPKLCPICAKESKS